MPNDSFCGRLRRERERRQIALASIAANTKISAGLFEALERGDVSRWPGGIYRRSFIRAYATAIGLDPDATTQEFLELFPDPDQVAAAAAKTPKFPATATPAVLRLTLAAPSSPFSAGRLLHTMRDRCAAVACDAGVVTAIATAVFVASGKFWLPFGVAMLGYYLGSILLLGNTPGVCLWAAPASRRPAKTSFVTTLRPRMAKAAISWFTGLTRSVAVSATPIDSSPDPRRPRSRSPA